MPNITIVLAGQVGVGKTTIFNKIKGSDVIPMSPSASSSFEELENHAYSVTLNGKDFKISLWDTGGLERYHSEMTGSYFNYCQVVILVYDASSDDLTSLFSLKDWILQAKSSSIYASELVFSLWASKCADQSSPISEPVQNFLRTHSIPETLYFRVTEECNIVDTFHKLIYQVYEDSSRRPTSIHDSGSVNGTPPQLSRPSLLLRCLTCNLF
jgi:small GTP-binding protein